MKLPYLDRWNQQRRENASLYDTFLEDAGDVIRPTVRQGSTHVYHLYVIRTVVLAIKGFLDQWG